jgi:hypothetical protein
MGSGHHGGRGVEGKEQATHGGVRAARLALPEHTTPQVRSPLEDGQGP